MKKYWVIWWNTDGMSSVESFTILPNAERALNQRRLDWGGEGYIVFGKMIDTDGGRTENYLQKRSPNVIPLRKHGPNLEATI